MWETVSNKEKYDSTFKDSFRNKGVRLPTVRERVSTAATFKKSYDPSFKYKVLKWWEQNLKITGLNIFMANKIQELWFLA